MNKKLTRVIAVVDRSRSTLPTQAITNYALNQFVNRLKTHPDECQLSLIQFGHQYDNGIPTQSVRTFPELTATEYQDSPTRLYDAVWRAIEDANGEMEKLSPNETPGAVVMVIMTDNFDTGSKRSLETVRESIARQQKDYNWHFIFLGGDQDAINSAKGLGIERESSLGYEIVNTVNNHNPMTYALTAAANYINALRDAVRENGKIDAVFTEEDRLRAIGGLQDGGQSEKQPTGLSQTESEVKQPA